MKESAKKLIYLISGPRANFMKTGRPVTVDAESNLLISCNSRMILREAFTDSAGIVGKRSMVWDDNAAEHIEKQLSGLL